MLETAERLIISEIGDFIAGLGHPGEPETPEQMQAELMARVQRVFADVRLQLTPTWIGVDLASGPDKTVEMSFPAQAKAGANETAC